MKVLLTRLSSMGDLIHTLPAVSDLSKMRPDIELHWFCEAGFADIARLHPFVAKVHEMSWRYWRKHFLQGQTWSDLADLRRRLRQERFDCVLDSQGLLKSALFSKMAGATVWGLDNESARESLAARLYHRAFAVEKGLSAVLRNRLLFAQAFAYELPQELDFGAAVLSGLQTVAPYYVALHASSRDSKLWRQDCWRDLLCRLHGRDGAEIYLPWGNETECFRARQIASGLPFAKVCDSMSLFQAAQLLQGSQGVIGVDTGLLHLANALDKPLVGIYTDTDPVKTGVQPSLWAANIGGVGEMPSADEVYDLLAANVAAKAAAAASE